MEATIIILATLYTFISYLMGFIDIFRLKSKMQEKGGLSCTTMEELGAFIGIRNVIFFPSVIIVVIVVVAIRLIKKVLD